MGKWQKISIDHYIMYYLDFAYKKKIYTFK